MLFCIELYVFSNQFSLLKNKDLKFFKILNSRKSNMRFSFLENLFYNFSTKIAQLYGYAWLVLAQEPLQTG